MAILEEAIKAVRFLNERIYNCMGDQYPNQVGITTNGDIIIIEFLDLTLYNSEDEPRRWIEKKNEYEPLLDYLQKQLRRNLILLKKLKF